MKLVIDFWHHRRSLFKTIRPKKTPPGAQKVPRASASRDSPSFLLNCATPQERIWHLFQQEILQVDRKSNGRQRIYSKSVPRERAITHQTLQSTFHINALAREPIPFFLFHFRVLPPCKVYSIPVPPQKSIRAFSG